MSVDELFECNCIDCPLAAAPPCFANALKELLDSTALAPRSPDGHDWKDFMDFFPQDFGGTPVASADNAVKLWLEGGPPGQHSIRKVLEFAIARHHMMLIKRYKLLIVRHSVCTHCAVDSDHSLCFKHCNQCFQPQDLGPYPPEPPPLAPPPPPLPPPPATVGLRSRPSRRPNAFLNRNPPSPLTTIDGVAGSAVVMTVAPDLSRDMHLYRMLNLNCPTPVKKGLGGFIVFFLALQVLAPLYITVCEDQGIYKLISKGSVSYSELLRRFLLANTRLVVRFITPLIFSVQAYLMAKNTHKFYADQAKCYKRLVSSLRPHILSPTKYKEILGSIGWREMPYFHAASFAGLLYYLGAFLTAEDRIMGEELCDLTRLFQVSLNCFGIHFNFLMFCDCLTVFCILLVTGIIKDSYCLENKIAKQLISPYSDAIRRRWVLVDVYLFVVSFCLTVFAVFSFVYGKPFTPDAFTDLRAHNVVTWFFWMFFLTVLQCLGLSANRYIKWGCFVGHLVGYGCIVFFLFVIQVENITLPPGSFVLLFYTSIAASEFNLLFCLLCNAKPKWTKVCCLVFLVSLSLTFCATVFRECVHLTLIVLV